MERNEVNFAALTAVFASALVISNILASKVLQVGPLEVPAAVIAYPITFLMTDVIGEIWGKRHAQKVVFIGILCQVVSLILIFLAVYLPPAAYMEAYNEEYKAVLGSTARIVFASLVSFIASQTCDVYVFHTIKEQMKTHKWVRNNVSTLCSQIIDSAIFVTIAFAGQGYDLLLMIGSQILVKWVLAVIDTPVFYILTKEKQQETAD